MLFRSGESATSRQKLKGFFIDRDKNQITNYIKDLENTIAINKTIIRNLMSESAQKDPSKSVMNSLNEENIKLHEQIKEVKNDRDDLQSKLLITEQIIEEYKGKEVNIEERMSEKVQEMIDQLNKKEYVVQSYERKLHRLIPVLKKYAFRDPEIQQLIQTLNIQINPKKMITNVVEENEVLSTEVQTARAKMAELESKLTEITQKNGDYLSIDKNRKGLEMRLYSNSLILGSNSTIDDTQKMIMENRLLKEKNKGLIEELDLLRDGLKSMQKKNEILGEELDKAKQEIEKLKAENFNLTINRKSEAFPVIKDDDENENEEDNIKIDDESFGVCCIKEDDLIKFMNN